MGVADLLALVFAILFSVSMYTRWPPLLFQVFEVGIPVVINSVLVAGIIRNLHNTRNNITELITDNHALAKEREHQRIGFMLVAIVVLFIICYIPQMSYVLLREFEVAKRITHESLFPNQLFSMISTLFLLINQSANVFLYCLINKQYRKNFLTTLRTFHDVYHKWKLRSNQKSLTEFVNSRSIVSLILKPPSMTQI
ncbi:G-protein coupled receptor 83-like [Watersipora subatra]|uniref:G-protein coupled receptor 83-like n=1 Tax=Watersipora subatra TaxID=2589382 RepID=UPI00355B1B0B